MKRQSILGLIILTCSMGVLAFSVMAEEKFALESIEKQCGVPAGELLETYDLDNDIDYSVAEYVFEFGTVIY